jgi:hypothetical protein
LDHQWIFDARYNLNSTTALLTGFSFLNVVGLYALSFAFWHWLFITNEGAGGVELQHLISMGIIHAMLVCFHSMALFKPVQKSD